MLYASALLSLAAVPALAAVHEAVGALPLGWQKSSIEVSDSAPVQLSISLQYQNIDKLDSLLANVSTPGSANYGKYLDTADLNSIFAASTETIDKVKSWLQGAGATIVSDSNGVIAFQSTVGEANKLLDTTFAVYTDGTVNKLRTLSYSVPDDLVDHIDVITPTTYFGSIKPQRRTVVEEGSPTIAEPPTKRQVLNPSCETSVTYRSGRTYTLLSPECLKELYNTGGYQADPKSGSTIAFGNFLNESASYSDLAKFEQIFKIPSQNFTVLALINGGVDDQNPLTESDGEANLDVQNIIGLVDGLPVYTYITGGSPPYQPDLLGPTQADNQNEPYLEYYTYLLSQPNDKLPYVISNSYGDHENTVPEKYARRVCNMIGLMGLRGRTILESSGDEGVGAVCRNNQAPFQAQFTPQFPGTCPYVTAVGGTQFVNPEAAWNASSGGFSFYFKQPWYQKQAVSTYLNKYINPVAKKYYSANNYTDFAGRGFPDISAHSLYPDYLTVINGTAVPNGGTSAAAPVVAALFALLNDARFRAGLPALGFVNPFLYARGFAGLNDITTGAAVGCAGVDLQNGIVIAGAGIIPYASWNATIGWDPATGLGTPDFQKLKGLALLSGGAPKGYGGSSWWSSLL